MQAFINVVVTCFTDDTDQLFKHFFIRGIYLVKELIREVELQMKRWRRGEVQYWLGAMKHRSMRAIYEQIRP